MSGNCKYLVKKILKPARVLKQNIVYREQNTPGKSVGKGRKIVVIESDDWGSIRVSSAKDYVELNRLGAQLDKDPFTKNDTLESEEDLVALFAMLKKHRDVNGRHPIITPYYAMRNADFQKIKESDYSSFADERFDVTMKKYNPEGNELDIVKQAIQDGIFAPQLHCLEHLNVAKWMRDLQNGRRDTRMAFDHCMYGVGTNFESNNEYGYMDAFHNRSEDELQSYLAMLAQAVADFEDCFGYKPTVFTAPCYVWDPQLEVVLHDLGIRILSGANHQLVPNKNDYEKFDKMIHPMGTTGDNGMVYLNRNVHFEMIYEYQESLEIAKRQVAAAFSKEKPAVISIHRANFVNAINGQRDDHLEVLDNFIRILLTKWPDIEFLSASELGELYINEK